MKCSEYRQRANGVWCVASSPTGEIHEVCTQATKDSLDRHGWIRYGRITDKGREMVEECDG